MCYDYVIEVGSHLPLVLLANFPPLGHGYSSFRSRPSWNIHSASVGDIKRWELLNSFTRQIPLRDPEAIKRDQVAAHLSGQAEAGGRAESD